MEVLIKTELENFFRSDKSNWYSQSVNREKKWDNKLVSIFWKRIREYKMDNNDYNFNQYIFPEFEVVTIENKYSRVVVEDETFWKKNKKKNLKKK